MANTPNTPVAVTEATVGQYVNENVPAMIKSYAVRNYDAQVWIRTVKLCIVENPDLMECLQTEAGKVSLRHALRFAATTGLSLNPQEGKAALVPIDGKVNYWPMKNGLVELALNTGAVARIRMNAVRAQDHFRISETMDGDSYEFSPNVKTRGEIIGFFCAIKLKSGPSLVEYMTREEMEQHRDTYGKGIRKEGSAWSKSFEGMGIAKVTKRAVKRLALAPEDLKVLDAALADGDAVEASFEETAPAGKGTSAAEVERKLAEKLPAAETQPAAAQAESVPAGAPGAQSSAAPAGAGAPAKPGEIF